LGPGRLFKRPYGTLSVFAREPGAEAPGYYQTSLREFGERRYQPKCYTPMLNAKCRMPTANADCECRLRMPTANADCLQGKSTLEDVALGEVVQTDAAE
jgi:hypothetical protein